MSRRVPWIAAAAVLLLHLLGNAHYGFFRDELYFIVCGRHPDWGYVDQPSLVPLSAAFTQLFGLSLFALRLVPALCAAGCAFVTCRIVQELRGGAYAQILATACIAFSPVLCSFGTKVSPDEVGLWLWPLAALYVLRLARGADPRWWLGVGIAIGIAGNAKYSVFFFAAALVVGIVLSPQHAILRTRWFAAGCAAAIVLLLPNALWQAAHDFPMWQLLEAGQHGKNLTVGPIAYAVQELFITNPLLAPIWIIGVAVAFLRRDLRWVGWTYVLLIAEMIVLHGKHYYPANVYPIVFAVGATAIAGWLARAVAPRAAVLAYAILVGAAMLPYVLPILPETQMADYMAAFARVVHVNLATEHGKASTLGSDYADMHGWPELAATVARIYRALPPAQRAQAAIFADNYGEAGAIDVFGKQYGLPPALSGHNQYWLWGPRGFSGNVIIDVNGECAKGSHMFRASRVVARTGAPWALPAETGIPISLCTGIAKPLASYWPSFKNYE